MFSSKRKKVKKYFGGLVALTGNEKRKAVTSPRLFTARDWRYVFLETRISLRDKKASMLSSGSAFFATLAFLTLVAAAIAITAYVVDADELRKALSAIEVYFPIDIGALIGSQLETAIDYNLRNFVVAALAILIALYSSMRAMQILISTTNTIYEKQESRTSLQLTALSFFMALGAIVVIIITLALVLIDEATLMKFGIPSVVTSLLPYARWIILTILITVSLGLVYRLSPSGHSPRWQWVTWGAGIASVLWLVATTLFFVYVKYFSIYNNVYNVLGSIIVLLIWFNLSAYIILFGAALNHRLEQRTTRRTSH